MINWIKSSKIKQALGNSAAPEVTREIEQAIPDILTAERVQIVSHGDAVARGLIERFDPRPLYLASLREFVDIEHIRNAGLNVVVDSMYGATAGLTTSTTRTRTGALSWWGTTSKWPASTSP